MSQNTTDTSMKSSSNTSETSLSIIQCSGIAKTGKRCRIFIDSKGQLFRSDKETLIPGPSGDFDNADCCRHNPDKVKKSSPIKMAIDKKKDSGVIAKKKKVSFSTISRQYDSSIVSSRKKKGTSSRGYVPTINSLLIGFNASMNLSKIPTV